MHTQTVFDDQNAIEIQIYKRNNKIPLLFQPELQGQDFLNLLYVWFQLPLQLHSKFPSYLFYYCAAR